MVAPFTCSSPLLDMKIDPDVGSNAGDAMSIVKEDFRSFLVESLEF